MLLKPTLAHEPASQETAFKLGLSYAKTVRYDNASFYIPLALPLPARVTRGAEGRRSARPPAPPAARCAAGTRLPGGGGGGGGGAAGRPASREPRAGSAARRGPRRAAAPGGPRPRPRPPSATGSGQSEPSRAGPYTLAVHPGRARSSVRAT